MALRILPCCSDQQWHLPFELADEDSESLSTASDRVFETSLSHLAVHKTSASRPRTMLLWRSLSLPVSRLVRPAWLRSPVASSCPVQEARICLSNHPLLSAIPLVYHLIWLEGLTRLGADILTALTAICVQGNALNDSSLLATESR
jgi:hypothetical protein